jgi:reactive intermediate/imine deaminase
MTIELISTPDATSPHGHYSQAVAHNGTLYISGILGNGPQHLDKERPIDAQAQFCLDNLEAILLAGGSDRSQVLKLGVFVSDAAMWPRVNALCESYFRLHRPARIVVPARTMRFGSLIEIDAIAARVARKALPNRPVLEREGSWT